MCTWLLRPILSITSRQPRTRVILVNSKKEVLLVRNWFGSQKWSFPGGNIKASESTRQAAARELFEELKLGIAAEDLVFITKTKHSKGFDLLHYSASIYQRSFKITKTEILDAKWFSYQDLPAHCEPEVLALVNLASLNITPRAPRRLTY